MFSAWAFKTQQLNFSFRSVMQTQEYNTSSISLKRLLLNLEKNRLLKGKGQLQRFLSYDKILSKITQKKVIN